MKNYVPRFLTLLLFSLIASAATDNLNIKPGLWEVTTSTQSNGAPPIPAAEKAEMEKQMAKMSPEMRAKIEAAQKKSQANMGVPHVRKSCITQEDLNKPLALDNGRDDGKCTRTVVKSTSSSQEIRVDCVSGERKSTGTLRMTAANSESWSGTMDTTVSATGGTINMKTSMSGKWLGAACGDVKPATHK